MIVRILMSGVFLVSLAGGAPCFAQPSGSLGMSAPKTCAEDRAACLRHVARASAAATERHQMADPLFSDPITCYKAFDSAKITGKWPQMGPYPARACVNN